MDFNYIIKHVSGWYFVQDESAFMINRFSTTNPDLATRFHSHRAAQEFIDDNMQEFTRSLLEIECVG